MHGAHRDAVWGCIMRTSRERKVGRLNDLQVNIRHVNHVMVMYNGCISADMPQKTDCLKRMIQHLIHYSAAQLKHVLDWTHVIF